MARGLKVHLNHTDIVRWILVVLFAAALALALSNQTDPLARIDKIVENTLYLIDKFLENLDIVFRYYISSIARSLSIIIGLAGAVLYFSGISRHTGRGMMIGAVALYILSQVVSSF